MSEDEARLILERINALRAATSELHLLVARMQELENRVPRVEQPESPSPVLH